MKLIKLEELSGGEILAKPILTSEYKILLSEETVLRREYIDRIKELGISEVYIKDTDQVHMQEVLLLKSELEDTFRIKVKEVLERHTYYNTGELKELTETADGIISSILDEEEVIEKVYDIKERNADIYEHSISLCSLATVTALKLKLSKEEVHSIGVGSLLHDLGLRYLTVRYENKPLEEMTKVEAGEYRKHPVYGYSAVKDEGWLDQTAKSIILYHHECLDGSGYPLHSREIPYPAGIVGVCDIFDEMICGIGCRKVKVYEAVEYLKTFTGVRYYKDIVDALLEFTAVYPVGSRVRLSDGSEGKVIRQNNEFPDRPVILLSKDHLGNPISGDKEINLIKVNNIFLEKELK